ncbi:MBL fold metallo-hydrolase [Stutzerimonas nitrititolerans]|uniref:MBL fold metallo-hydrolase n=1 Tax=Stutzerimonas nitrititolerans TaxID=2482751 RepID=UPI001BDD7A42|nr:MBL fold metallo-hydrolase [Stutzerimonas nitrititolerans]MBT1118632.1 MBL fold metallo-hydrolase [Stutzerimonas nitrititolerans]
MNVAKLVTLLLLSLATSAMADDELRFSLVKTAQSDGPGDYSWRNGSWEQPEPVHHLALLIEYQGSRLLFGTGLGRQINAQLDAELPWRAKRYSLVVPVRDQLERDGLKIDRILLANARWDHASGLADFPDVPVLASAKAIDYSQAATPPAVLPSQFAHSVRWQPLQFDARPVGEFSQSLDLFRDGRVVLVPLPRAGALGLFLMLSDGVRFFFRGDTLGEPEKLKIQPGGLQSWREVAGSGFYPGWVQAYASHSESKSNPQPDLAQGNDRCFPVSAMTGAP